MLEAITQYFAHVPRVHRVLFLAGGITFFWLMESAIPLLRLRRGRWKHGLHNLFFLGTTMAVNFSMAFLIVIAGDFVVTRHMGLLQWVNMPPWADILVGLLLLDFIGAFLIHWAEHKVGWMWKFHLTHHADTHVDVTTATRHHPVENVFRMAFTLLAILVSGAPVWLVLLHLSISMVVSQFNHANIYVPEWLDRSIRWVIVSPNMHKVHHHYRLPETNSNYGKVFSIWDRIFRTYRHIPTNRITYGLDKLDAAKSLNVVYQLGIPFRRNIGAGTDVDSQAAENAREAVDEK